MAMRQLGVCLAAAACLLTVRAGADTPGNTNPQCIAAYEEAQVDKKWGHLGAAREHLLACSGVACPSWMRKECQSWLEEVERATPTVVLGATIEGEERTQVQVELDGKPWVQEIVPRALPVELGEHVITFKTAGYPPIEKRVVFTEGEKLKRVRAEFEKPKPAAPAASGTTSAQPAAPPPVPVRPVPVGVWVLGGVAVAALGTAIVLGTGANDEKTRLEGSCSPGCAESDVDSLQGRYTATNVAIGVGVAAAIGAVTWFFARPTQMTYKQPMGQFAGPKFAGPGALRFEF